MSKSSKRTGGEWINCRGGDRSNIETKGPDNDLMPVASLRGPDREANAHTIALAGTTANKLDALGFDGDACIEALPEIVAALRELYEDWLTLARQDIADENADAVKTDTQTADLLSRLRPAKGGER